MKRDFPSFRFLRRRVRFGLRISRSGVKAQSMKKLYFLVVVVMACLGSTPSGAASVIQFKYASFEANEAAPIAHLTITCTPAPTAPVTALLKRTGGTAVKSDFLWGAYPWWESGLGIGFWGPGQSETTVDLYLADDGIPEPDETVEFTLGGITGDG